MFLVIVLHDYQIYLISTIFLLFICYLFIFVEALKSIPLLIIHQVRAYVYRNFGLQINKFVTTAPK